MAIFCHTLPHSCFQLAKLDKLDRHGRQSRSSNGKKRKLELIDPDAERNVYSSFVHAANSISQLYAQAVTAQKRSSAAASRQTLERIAHFLMREYAASDAIPKAELLHFLHQEYEGLEGCENATPHSAPQPGPAGAHMDSAGQPGGMDGLARTTSQPMHHGSTGHSPLRRPGSQGFGAGAVGLGGPHGMLPSGMDSYAMDPATQTNNQQLGGGGFNGF